MKLQRLFTMGPTEFAVRARQQASKTIARLTAPDGESAPLCALDSRREDAELQRIVALFADGESSEASRQLQLRFRLQAPARFFAGTADAVAAAAITAGNPALRQQVIADADAVCRGEFDILGYGKLSFGTPINWQSEPVTGLDIPRLHWSRIQPLHKAQVGDSKVVWELNRHQWLLDLGQAYRLTGDERYATTAVTLLADWMHANPPGLGINWSSSLEVALRLIAWCWALMLFQDSKAFTAEFFVVMLGWMQAHARYIERYLSHYFSPNTHLTGEALGLYYAGTLLTELQGAVRWRALGREILQDQMQRQVHADGVYFEQSTSYQYYTVEIYLHFLLLAGRNAMPVPSWMTQRFGKMLEFLLAVRRPDNTVPMIGDADGGWLLPLVRRQPGDHRGVFCTAALLLGNGNLAWAAGALAPETRWLLGAAAASEWQSLPSVMPKLAPLDCFHAGGYVVLRDGWHSRAHQLILDAGPLGCPVSGGHGHADLLSIQCSAFGEAYLVDPGTCCYTANPLWRDYFRSSHAHSTVIVDDRSQATPSGPFAWQQRPVARLRFFSEKPGYCVAGAEHSAYGDLADPVVHQRRVVFVDARYWVIIDDLTGTGTHRVDVRFQFAPLPVAIEADGWVRAVGNHSALLLKTFSAATVQSVINNGVLDPPAGWLSPNYGQRVAAPSLSQVVDARLPLRIVTLIYPLAEKAAPPPRVVPMFEHGELAGLAVGNDNHETIRMSDGRLSVRRSVREWH